MSTSLEGMETDEYVHEVMEDEVEEQELREEENEGELEGVVGADKEEGGDEDDDDENPTNEKPAAGSRSKENRRKKESTVRGPGELILPFSRVQKVIKADKDTPMVARDAVFLIGLATESFITELAVAAHRIAMKEKRATVQHKDIAAVVRKADEFMFLEDILPYTASTPIPEKKGKRLRPTGEATKDGVKYTGPTLDKFVVSNREKEAEEDNETEVFMNEDGTMYAVIEY